MSPEVPRQESKKDPDFMGVALDMARLGLGRTSPNPAVGAVIVKKGKILATGFHKSAGMPHAEREALTSPPAPLLSKERVAVERRPGEVWKDATLYVTLEPCCHHGRTPPCTDAIIQSGIKEVVVGMCDPDPKVSGKGIEILRKAGIRVRVGVMEKECREINEAYIKHRKTGLPLVTVKMATTLDGKVGVRHRDGRCRPCKITGRETDRLSHELRDRTDAILVGIGTVLSDDPRLTTRLPRKRGKDPIRIVLDTSLRIPKTARLFRVRSPAPTWVATTLSLNHPRAASLRRRGIDLIVCRKKKGGIDLKGLLKELGRRGVLSLLVEGGVAVWGGFLREKLADRLLLFIAPKVLGKEGVPMRVDQKKMPRLKRVENRWVGSDLMVEGRLNSY